MGKTNIQSLLKTGLYAMSSKFAWSFGFKVNVDIKLNSNVVSVVTLIRCDSPTTVSLNSTFENIVIPSDFGGFLDYSI
jgi:hypothetical protein